MSAFPYILLTVLIHVESGGNDRAMGDYRHGQPTAFGCLQISDAVIADVRRISGRSYTREDAFNRQTAGQICLIYLSHYVTRDRLGYEPTMEDYARCWNGGPTGWRNPATLPYWTKVRKELNRLRNLSPVQLPIGSEPKQGDRPNTKVTRILREDTVQEPAASGLTLPAQLLPCGNSQLNRS